MVFCKNCGAQLPRSNVIYCPICGILQNQTSRTAVGFQTKDTATAVIIALIGGLLGFCGIGHMYIGKVAYGIGLLIVGWGMLFLTWLGIIGGITTGILAPLAIFALIYIVYWIWQAYDVYKKAKYYNGQLKRYGNESW